MIARDHEVNLASHEHWMQRCIDLAKQARGQTAPNPMVGSVIVKNGEILGEGFHPKAGDPHAEVFAIRAAQQTGVDLSDATLYVNLEPCNHHGRTPPCSEGIIQAGIGNVVVGAIDADPRVSGSGCDRLRSAGLNVTTGILEQQCLDLNEAFFHRVKTNLPFGIFKYAMTLDGKIATTSGHSYWITGKEARQVVHDLRLGCDAIITGGNTVRLDNPHLTTHGLSEHSPLRVVVTKSFDLPEEANLWKITDTEKTLVITLPHRNPQLQQKLCDRHVEILELEDISPLIVMQELAKRGCNQVLWECGGRLGAAAIKAKMVQKIYAFIAPKLIGGFTAPSPIDDLELNLMTDAINLLHPQFQQIGTDFLITGYTH
ncbi:bifunctional diaminohydroxyphosphoribosylaminopyrimidine deaminase/5-amino-6-(5-phosphoribosylamino)uracil reductase RibD [Pseudanabaena sp. ABRG5-3]|uniref:bifunctional diaminohydroxyphosphoribosylaminopyrimidine deaminase/5-amino-6-(5-phosphoribosylamino)uracil reductase RibD n=1 Tax=Pseudanabaena sp. ABRG5-3 TaxID=685565 RepID=UPI000DC73C93|nr:bifunctional diaminohydroxyphosphoribosylaminopyrimidine deaminase/5-amino-6-(5-phosphoribosylamino)uracil reductase RibD [Pseudanabaena sp. ABRG5-3]BBC23679.1 riboflavin biosynthesis protein [Pseudanabaena sp. ABRG5-3]